MRGVVQGQSNKARQVQVNTLLTARLRRNELTSSSISSFNCSLFDKAESLSAFSLVFNLFNLLTSFVAEVVLEFIVTASNSVPIDIGDITGAAAGVVIGACDAWVATCGTPDV